MHRRLPMFPLGVVLLPGAVLPLLLFEPRYLELHRRVSGGSREFGVVLIERGTDRGGEDTRFSHGCLAKIVGSAAHEDGRVSIVTVGTKRLKVIDWDDPEPYPVARVDVLDDDPLTERGKASVDEARQELGTLKALASELGVDVGIDPPRLSDGHLPAMYQVAQLAGLQVLDLQRVLAVPTSDERAGLIRDLVADQVALIRMQLGAG